MIRLIDVTYYTHQEYSAPEQVLYHHRETLGYLPFIENRIDVQVVKHLNFEGSREVNGIKFSFFKNRNKFFHVPFKTHNYIRKQKPDAVLVQGLIFPVQLIFLRMAVGRKCRILIQHHGERPFGGIKKAFQQVAGMCTDAYIFTTLGNTKKWIDSKIIKNREMCFEILEGSTYMKRHDKEESRAQLQMEGDDIFLWVGRLDIEKGPITILTGFEKYLLLHPDAKLYMIYQAEPLLAEVKDKINDSTLLKKAVKLVGKIPHEEIEYWYSAADYYVSGSHREGSGFGLIESMACGCIPIVTDIAPFRKIAGGHGFLFQKDDPDGFYTMLVQASKVRKEEYSKSITDFFQEEHSFKVIADQLVKIVSDITIKHPN